MARILIAGCGFLGEAAAFLFREAAWDVYALTASEESAQALRDRGLNVSTADISQMASVAAIRRKIGAVDGFIHCASSGRGGPAAYREVYLKGMHTLCALFPDAVPLFVSSTSVYGQSEGEWVTESCPAEPTPETGRILLAAEKVALEAGGWVTRLSGIYGPGRSVYLRKLLNGDASLENGGTRWINQIHRDDAARALFHLVSKGSPRGIYNVSDNTPCSQRQVYEWLAAHFNRDLPPEGPVNPNRKRGLTSKRVSNARLREVGWEAGFPSYRDAIGTLVPNAEKADD